MARKSEKISLAISPKARGDLASIWRWNAEAYGANHADRYLEFVINGAEKLIAGGLLAKAVPGRSAYSYVLIRKSRRGHGHVAVFTVDGKEIHILRFFHTAEDWRSKL